MSALILQDWKLPSERWRLTPLCIYTVSRSLGLGLRVLFRCCLLKCHVLDLLPGRWTGCCLMISWLPKGYACTKGQPSKQGVPACADIFFAQCDHTYCPSTPVLVSDMKVLDLEHAGNETTCYVAKTHHMTPALPVLLALPATATAARLEVHVPMIKQMWRISICTAPLTERALLSTVYAAVEYLYTCNTTHKDTLTSMCPFQDWMTSNAWKPLGDPSLHDPPSVLTRKHHCR